jgi:hypothetical protein
MVDEKTPIEPLVRMVEERRQRDEASSPRLEIATIDEDPEDLFGEDEPPEDPTRGDPEERPTLPRMSDRKAEPFTFTAFDFAVASDALDRIDSSPPPEEESDDDGASELPTLSPAQPTPSEPPPTEDSMTRSLTEDSTKRALTPPSRVGSPPPKPPSSRNGPAKLGSLTNPSFPPMATPPGGFAMDDLDDSEATRPVSRPSVEPAPSEAPPASSDDEGDRSTIADEPDPGGEGDPGDEAHENAGGDERK